MPPVCRFLLMDGKYGMVLDTVFKPTCLCFQKYNGFNLIVGDLKLRKLAYFSNRSGRAPEELPPGLFGISNGELGSQWPKVEQGKANLKTLLNNKTVSQLDPHHIFQQVMGDTAKALSGAGLPQTGLPEALESQMSSIFLDAFQLYGAPYGTRSQTLLVVHKNGSAELHERSLHAPPDSDTSKHVWDTVHHKFECSI